MTILFTPPFPPAPVVRLSTKPWEMMTLGERLTWYLQRDVAYFKAWRKVK